MKGACSTVWCPDMDCIESRHFMSVSNFVRNKGRVNFPMSERSKKPKNYPKKTPKSPKKDEKFNHGYTSTL